MPLRKDNGDTSMTISGRSARLEIANHVSRFLAVGKLTQLVFTHEALGCPDAPRILEQLGELLGRHRLETHQDVGMAVVVRCREEGVGLALQQGLAFAEVGYAQHQCVGIAAQATDALAPEAQGRRAVGSGDLHPGKPKSQRNHVFPRCHLRTLGAGGGLRRARVHARRRSRWRRAPPAASDLRQRAPCPGISIACWNVGRFCHGISGWEMAPRGRKRIESEHA